MSPDDSGKVYSSVLSPDRKEFYFFKKVTPGQEDYRIYRSTLTSGIGVQVSYSISAGTIPIYTRR
jgi:hypothetical protein